MQHRVFLTLVGTVSLLAFAWFLILPSPGALGSENPARTSLMEYRMAQWEREGAERTLRQEWVSLEAISPHLPRAVLAAEDDRFYQHRGLDWLALAEEVGYAGGVPPSWTDPDDLRALFGAVRFGVSNRDELRGRSTISQQVAKNLYLSPERTLWRKGLELVLALRLERRLEKDRILEIYLNVAEWGPGIFGAEAASREYFGVSSGALTLEQAAALAATLPHPLWSNPARNSSWMEWRKNVLLDRLRGPEPAAPEPGRSLPALGVEGELHLPEDPGLHLEDPAMELEVAEFEAPPDGGPLQ